MNLRNCPECGRLFELMVRDLCPKCIDKEEADFALIKNFLRQNPGMGISEVCEETGVTEKKVLQLIRTGRLLLETGNMNVNCECCGKPIESGRYCDSCYSLLDKNLEGIISKSEVVPRQINTGEVKEGRFTKHFRK